MSDVLEKFDELPREEQWAYLGFFGGAMSKVVEYKEGYANFGKYECEQVDLYEFWLTKVVELGWIVAETEEKKHKLQPDVIIKFHSFTVTRLGHAVLEAYWGRVNQRANL